MGSWFVVLPDTDAAADVARGLLIGASPRVVRHPSGRPWLLGVFTTGRLVVGSAPNAALAVFGEHVMTSQAMAARAVRLASASDVERCCADIHGSFHVAASRHGVTRVRGSATGLRRLYHARVRGVPVVSDHADVLARLADADLDQDLIAARLLFPAAPWPLGWQSVWTGVSAVPPGHAAELTQRHISLIRWWRPPLAVRSAAQGAEALRTALTEAVRVRVRVGAAEPVVAHLSGLDSSSLCSLAAREGGELIALTAAQPDPMDEDVAWARRTATALRDAGHPLAHEVIPADACPLVYDGLLTARADLDEPFPFLHNQARFRDIVRRGLARGGRVQLMGLGGDELVAPAGPFLRAVLRDAPLVGLGRLRATAARERRSSLTVLRAVLRPGSYPDWLETVARSLGQGSGDDRGVAGFGWGAPPVLPAWVTQDAVERARACLRRAARADPSLPSLGEDSATHATLAVIHTGSQVARAFQHLAAREGGLASMPFLDDQVMDAVLAVRPAARLDPARYKPLLVEAMRGVVPEVTLRRVTKSDTAAAAVLGSRRHRDQIAGLAQDSQLVQLGLVDLPALRRAVHGVIDVVTPSHRIEPTLGVERWLRDHSEERDVLVGG